MDSHNVVEFWKRFDLLETAPIECEYKIGEKVIYTNDYGLEFEVVIVGFSADEVMFGKYGKFIHFVVDLSNPRSSAYWMPHKKSDFRKIL